MVCVCVCSGQSGCVIVSPSSTAAARHSDLCQSMLARALPCGPPPRSLPQALSSSTHLSSSGSLVSLVPHSLGVLCWQHVTLFHSQPADTGMPGASRSCRSKDRDEKESRAGRSHVWRCAFGTSLPLFPPSTMAANMDRKLESYFDDLTPFFLDKVSGACACPPAPPRTASSVVVGPTAVPPPLL
jgi:hypothetical protein